MISPAKYSPSIFFDAMVFGSISPTFTPPEVTMAFSTGIGAVTLTVQCFKSVRTRSRCARVMSCTFSCGGVPERSMNSSIIFCGRGAPSTLQKSLLACFSKSDSKRLSSICSSSAGLRSISSRYCFLSKCRMCALAERMSGPLTPKCVKSISPKSEWIFLLFS